jgi:hypothetical protein
MAREVCSRAVCILRSHSLLNGSLKITSRYMPIAIDPEGVAVRDPYFIRNDPDFSRGLKLGYDPLLVNWHLPFNWSA